MRSGHVLGAVTSPVHGSQIWAIVLHCENASPGLSSEHTSFNLGRTRVESVTLTWRWWRWRWHHARTRGKPIDGDVDFDLMRCVDSTK
jgi:hypothetical protein